MKTKFPILALAALIGGGFFSSHHTQAFDLSKNVLPAAVANVVTNTDSFVLFSLDPTPAVFQEPVLGKKITNTFHGYPILGQVTITNSSERSELLAAYLKAIRDSDGSVALCFSPRHGISAKHRDQKVDLVICFECLQTRIYFNDRPTNGVQTTKTAQPTFDRSLEKAGVPTKPKQSPPTVNPAFE